MERSTQYGPYPDTIRLVKKKCRQIDDFLLQILKRNMLQNNSYNLQRRIQGVGSLGPAPPPLEMLKV